jgi:hypothetical protein
MLHAAHDWSSLERHSEYRKNSSSEIWHFCSNCSQWPPLTFVSLTALPDGAQVCSECISKSDAAKGPGAHVGKEIDLKSPIMESAYHCLQAIAPVRAISLCRLRQEELSLLTQIIEHRHAVALGENVS